MSRVDDTRIYDYYIAGRASAALAVGVHVGLFDLLDREPLDQAALAARLGFAARPVDLLLRALRAMGLVVLDARGVYSLATDAAAALVRGKPGYLGGLIALEVEHFLSPRLLLDALERDNASVYGEADPWQQHEADPEQARAFTAAMHSVSARPAEGLADTLELTDVERLLDVGGGSGVYDLALARRWPHLRCTVLEMPAICGLAAEYIRAAELAERIDVRPGDMFGDPLPRGYDAMLFSQIFHDWPPERGRVLAARAYQALEPGGCILVHEKLVEDDGRGPLANALVNLDMLVWTEGQQWSHAELAEVLREAGFVDVERCDTVGYWSVVVGYKR